MATQYRTNLFRALVAAILLLPIYYLVDFGYGLVMLALTLETHPPQPMTDETISWIARIEKSWCFVEKGPGKFRELDLSNDSSEKDIENQILQSLSPAKILRMDGDISPQLTIGFQAWMDPTNIDLQFREERVVFQVRHFPWVYESPNGKHIRDLLRQLEIDVTPLITNDSLAPKPAESHIGKQ